MGQDAPTSCCLPLRIDTFLDGGPQPYDQALSCSEGFWILVTQLFHTVKDILPSVQCAGTSSAISIKSDQC